MVAYRFVKRGFDLISASLVIIVFLPVWILVAAGIKFSSKGPVFYTTERVGRGRKKFVLYKFRSMHVYQPGSDDDKNEHTYIANASRIFPFGRFLRKTKLDEIPQLINIVLGQMSVIGPRPVPEKTAERNYSGDRSCILDVRPGLSCLDSLFDYAHGELFVKSIEEYREKIVPVRNELAKMYVERRGIGMDCYCILRTLKLMFEIAITKKTEFTYTRYEAEAERRVMH